MNHENRVMLFRKLRSLKNVFPGSYMSMEKKDSYMPTWKLLDRRGKEIASLSSVHVWRGLWNHFPEGFSL